MHRRQRFALGGLVGGVGLVLLLAAPVHSQRPRDRNREETMTQRVARKTKLKEEDIVKVIQALGPEMMEELRRGRTVDLPGLGGFRVVRIPAHKDIEIGTGRPKTIPSANLIEFKAAGELDDAANDEGVQPAAVVPPFEYIVIPGQTPGQKTPRVRTSGRRTP